MRLSSESRSRRTSHHGTTISPTSAEIAGTGGGDVTSGSALATPGGTPSPAPSSYPGGKGASGLCERIIRQMPPHEVYIEPFAGHAAVARRKLPASLTILNDTDPNVHFWLHRNARNWYPNIEVGALDGLHLVTTSLHCRQPTTLVYFDPPYLDKTRTRALYEYEFCTTAEHETLLRVARSLPCLVMISGYASKLYDGLLKGWRCVRMAAQTRGGMRAECLWCNFAEPTVLHDPRFAGLDYRERERIKKKKARWARRFEAMDPRERQAVASVLASVDRAAVEAAVRSARPEPATLERRGRGPPRAR